MSNIARMKVRICGTRPILFHHFGPDAIPLDKRQERTGVAGNDPEEWKKTVMMTKDRQLYVESTYIFGMCREAAKYTKKGIGSIQSKVAATLQVDEDRILLDRFVPEEPTLTDDAEKPVYLDIRSVKNPATRGRNVRYRVAASAGWRCEFTLIFDRTIVSTAEMKAVLNDAGALVGLADGRSVGFGRFAVENVTDAEA